MVPIAIQSVSGQELLLDVSVGESIHDVKQKIETSWGLPIFCQRLLKKTEECSDIYCLQEKDAGLELLCLISLERPLQQLSCSSSAERAEGLKQLRRLRGQPAALEAAKKALEDVNALVRSVAVDAIVEVARDAEVMELAESMLALDPRFSVKLFGRAGQRVRLLELLASQDSELRQVVAEELTSSAQPGNHALLTCFLQLLRDPDREGFMNVRLLALRGLQKMSPLDDVLVEELPMHLRDRNMYICTAAIELLKSQQKSWVLAVLPQFLRSVPNPEVQASLLLLLGDLMSELTEDLAMVLSEILGGNEPALQRSAALLLMPYVTRDGLEQEGLERRLRGEGWTQACREVWRSSADWFQQNSEHKLSRKIPEGLQEPIWSQRSCPLQ